MRDQGKVKLERNKLISGLTLILQLFRVVNTTLTFYNLLGELKTVLLFF